MRKTGVLIGIYLLTMFAVVKFAPWQTLDQLIFVRTSHSGQLANDITVIDVRASPADDQLATRHLITRFLDELVMSKQQPTAVILDFVFDPCQAPCEGARASVRDALTAAIAKVRASHIPVYADENLTAASMSPRGDEITGVLEDLDPKIYGPQGLAGAAGDTDTHIAGDSGMIFYHPCYRNVVMPPDAGIKYSANIWAIVWRVQRDFDASVCQTQALTFSVGRRISDSGMPYSTIPHRAPSFYSITKKSPFPKDGDLGDWIILGSFELDTLDQDANLATTPAGAAWEKLHGAGSLKIPAPEILAWELSDRLQQQASDYYATHPFGKLLYVLTPAFSLITAVAFVACFLLLRRLRLGRMRRFLPWISATSAGVIGFGLFAGAELLLALFFHRVQPQVTLVCSGIALSAVLCGIRGSQLLPELAPEDDEEYDYDVFISYSHDDIVWVREHIFSPLADVRLSGGQRLSIFFDKSALYIGDDWRRKLTLAIVNSRSFIAVYSESYFKRRDRGYCAFELGCAYDRWINLGKASRFLLPIMRGDATVPPEYRQAQYWSTEENPDVMKEVTALIIERVSKERHEQSS